MSRSSTSSSSELLRAHCAAIAKEEAALREGGGKAGHERQRKMDRLPVRERLGRLLDKDSPFFEMGLWAAYKCMNSAAKFRQQAGVIRFFEDLVVGFAGRRRYRGEKPGLRSPVLSWIIDISTK
jgi:acetyl-CoA carboxylase carboxyltransferase component